jgi:predicted P-loop ATPase
MVVLEHPTQGGDKSTLLATLAGHDDWFSDDLPLNADSQRVIERTRGRWIIEAAELSGMRKADIEHLKAFLSRQRDRARMAYGRFVDDVPRQFIIVGTTNNSEYLLDPTGNRRFWPIKIEQVDIAALRRDRDQLWAEAAAREARGESIRLARERWPAASDEQEARRTRDPWEDALADIPYAVPRYARDETTGQPVEVGQTTIVHQAGGQQLVSSKDLLEYVLKVPVGQQDTRHSMRLAHAMKLAGWFRNPNGKVFIGGQRVQGYWRPDAM